MPTKVRPAGPGDASPAVKLMTQLAEYCQGQVEPGLARRFALLLESEKHGILVAESEPGLIVGLLHASHRMTLWHAGPCAIIEELAVDEAYRGKGVGRVLIEAALDWAEGQGCSEIELSTEPDNRAALAFYHTLGFEDTGLLLERELGVIS